MDTQEEANSVANVFAEGRALFDEINESLEKQKVLLAKLQRLLEAQAMGTVLDGLAVPKVHGEATVGAASDDFMMSKTNVKRDIFQRLRAAIVNCTAPREFPVGSFLPNIWVYPKTGVEYDLPLCVMDYRMVKLADGRKTMGAILCPITVLSKFRMFDGECVFFGESDLRRYLNSDKDGYLAGCSTELKNVMAEVNIGESYYNDPRRVCCKVFVPSLEELHFYAGEYSQNQIDELCWEYFRNTPTKWDIRHNKRFIRDLDGRTQYVWLRSRCNYSCVCYVRPNGLIAYSDPSNSYGVLPACVVVGADVESETIDTDGNR